MRCGRLPKSYEGVPLFLPALVHQNLHPAKPDSGLPPKERVWQNISAVCDLFDMARDIKILELGRRYPEAHDE